MRSTTQRLTCDRLMGFTVTDGSETRFPDEDRVLLDAARTGDSRALHELWGRHHAAASRYALSLTRRFDADDLVSEAFLRVFSALRNGGGPTEALRPYLFVTIRNIAVSWAKQPESRSLENIDEPSYDANVGSSLIAETNQEKLQEALRSLPVQWQQILWATEIEGQRPAELSKKFGLQANSVAALAYRAREALKHAWVQVHVEDDLGSGDHRWVRERVGRYVCHALTARQRERFQEHTGRCVSCARVVRDAEHLAMLPIGVSALVLLSVLTPPLRGLDALSGAAALPSRGRRARPRLSARGLTRGSVIAVTSSVTAAAILIAGTLAVLRTSTWFGDSSPSLSTEAGARSETARQNVTSALPSAPVSLEPTEAPPTPSLVPTATPLEQKPSASSVPSSPNHLGTATTTFTRASIGAGFGGIATVEMLNNGGDFTQRADTMSGSTAVFRAPSGLTFEPQDTLLSDYQYAGGSRTSSAIIFTHCTSDDTRQTLSCDVEAASSSAPDVQEWVWGAGDTRRIYLKVAVADDRRPGTLTGTAQLELQSETVQQTDFEASWTVDVTAPAETQAPTVESVDPTGEDTFVSGSAQPSRMVSVRSDGVIVGQATADALGKWTIMIPWAESGTLSVEAV